MKISLLRFLSLLLVSLFLLSTNATAQVMPFGFFHSESSNGNNNSTLVVELTSATTNRIWMDRNLGATRAATSATDYQAYGSLYQFGRGSDGHQTIVWISPTASDGAEQRNIIQGPVNLGSEGSNFIKSPGDWLSTRDDNRWNANQTSGGAVAKTANDPCPAGYRIPTLAEWQAEIGGTGITNAQSAWEILKLPSAGFREYQDGGMRNLGTGGRFWSSTANNDQSSGFYFGVSNYGFFPQRQRSYGWSVRCIKD